MTTEAGSTTAADETTGEASSGTTGDDLLDECPRLRVDVAPDPTLNVRSTPSTELEPIGKLVHGEIVETVAAVQGESIDGNTLWYQIAAPAGYVSGQFVECTQDVPPPPPEGYYLPLACGMSAKITQGNNGNTSHTGKAQYAFDFGIALDTPLHAMADGTVLHVYAETGPGDPCYDGGGPECFPHGNLVVLLHGDGSTTLYKHLNKVDVALEQVVPRGGMVGLSGSTGYSTGPHAHVMRMENCGLNNCQSIPLEFIEAGVPVQGQTVTSKNCP
jgi:murein DD-endopeptidase MepM/ murein hydrolase activator NlpD